MTFTTQDTHSVYAALLITSNHYRSRASEHAMPHEVKYYLDKAKEYDDLAAKMQADFYPQENTIKIITTKGR